MLLVCCSSAIAQSSSSSEEDAVEATTAITLPVDSVTIYPDGLVYVKRTGILDVTEGEHKFVVNIPSSADKSSALLSVTNATIERVVYDGNPVYTLNISSPGKQEFVLSYLMNSAGSWAPRYNLHLANDSVKISANAVVSNRGGEDLKNVRIKLVAGLPTNVPQYYAKKAAQINYAEAVSADMAVPAPAPALAESTGELETLYIFELPGRKDLEMDKEIAFTLFENAVPLMRMYTWDATSSENGPAVEEIRANNTMQTPWPSGQAMLYKDDEYVSTLSMPFTPTGTNASIVIGPSPDLKVSKKLTDYNITESIKPIKSDNTTHTVKETTERWTYNLKIENNLDRNATLEASDSRPKEAKIISVSPKPVETTATGLKWRLTLSPREKTAIDYSYQVVTTESLDASR